MVVCPITDCRNIDHHLGCGVVDHLVRRGMDESYKQQIDWYHHGDVVSQFELESKGSEWNEEIVGLYKAAGYLDEELASKGDL